MEDKERYTRLVMMAAREFDSKSKTLWKLIGKIKNDVEQFEQALDQAFGDVDRMFRNEIFEQNDAPKDQQGEYLLNETSDTLSKYFYEGADIDRCIRKFHKQLENIKKKGK